MEAKHTPGPWKAETLYYNLRISAERIPVVGNGEFFIAEMKCDGGSGDNPYAFTLAEAQANAQLIAAAPDLLEALEGLYEHCPMFRREWREGEIDEKANAAMKAGLQAIAKAKGAIATKGGD
jgi:hypothetical protein